MGGEKGEVDTSKTFIWSNSHEDKKLNTDDIVTMSLISQKADQMSKVEIFNYPLVMLDGLGYVVVMLANKIKFVTQQPGGTFLF